MQAVLPMVDSLSKMLGSQYEVVLHDLERKDSSLVALSGNLTKRKLGSPITSYILRLLKKHGNDAPDQINYRSMNKDGRTMRSTTMFIRDESGAIIGCLCINQDLTDAEQGLKLLKELCMFQDQNSEDPHGEYFASDIPDVLQNLVLTELEPYGRPPIKMAKDEKFAIVTRLEAKGVFDVKGSVEFVANCFGSSQFTIYNYLKQIRSKKRKEV